jgi:predicted phage gp36 major capsid-like protein
VAFGGLAKYVVRRAPLIVRRLATRFADFGQIAFIAFRRVDGNLIDGCAGQSVALLQNVF